MGPYVVCDGPLGQGECDFFLKKTSLQEGSMQGLDVNIRNERSVYVDMLARLVKRVPWASFAGGLR